MLGIGFFEIIIIALVCFIAVGPKQLPVVMRKIAGFYRQFASLRDEFRFQILSADLEDKKDEVDASSAREKAKTKETIAREENRG